MVLLSELLILTICLFKINESVQNNKVKDELRRIFHRDISKVPKYKAVKVKTDDGHRSKRELRSLEFEVDGQSLKFHLTPIKDNVIYGSVPVWTVETAQNMFGHAYHKIDFELNGTFYQDAEKMAILLAYDRNGQIYYDGVFGEGDPMKVVKSISEKSLLKQGTEWKEDHVIFDVEKNKNNIVSLGEDDQPTDESKLDKPLDVMYPKILVIVDYDSYKATGENIEETMKHVLIFWNGVNLKYSEISYPKVKIIITGVIIAKDPTALKYIYDNRQKNDMSKLSVFPMLDVQAKYFRYQFLIELLFNNYDVTITMSNLDTNSLAGATFQGKICDSMLNAGFVNEDMNFSGLYSAVHELGHLLNLPHDGLGSTIECNKPDFDQATIMAPAKNKTVGRFVWSECSKRALKNFATLKRAECLETLHTKKYIDYFLDIRKIVDSKFQDSQMNIYY